MIRVKIVVEGQTEESFVKDVLAPWLWPRNITLTPILHGVPGHKGGRPSYERVKKDILLHLKQDKAAYCSTMLDYYRLGADFPGSSFASNLPAAEKAIQIEHAVKDDICACIPEFRPDLRLFPYIQMHEYEGLLFSDPLMLASAIKKDGLATYLQQIREEFPSPEDIDDGPLTAPSKRILAVHPRYNKVLDGTIAAQAVSIDANVAPVSTLSCMGRLLDGVEAIVSGAARIMLRGPFGSDDSAARCASARAFAQPGSCCHRRAGELRE